MLQASSLYTALVVPARRIVKAGGSFTCTGSNIMQRLNRCGKYITAAVGIFIITHAAMGQKVAVVKTSPLTGIALPEGSKQDKRLLMTAAADITMAETAKKNKVSLAKAEVLYLPLQFTAAALTGAAQEAGWTVTPDNSSKDFYWLQKEGKNILACFYPSQKEHCVYFAESNQPPAGNSDVQVQQETPQQNNSATTQQEQLTPNEQPGNTITPTPGVRNNFAFNSTHFDDGWTSTVQEDWVEVTKGNIKVLLHYPKEGTVFPADPEPLTNAAWNILVAPRYSHLKNYRTAYITTYNRPYLGMGYLTENSTGKEVFVVLFRQGEGWIEFITPDKNSFIQQYKFDPEGIRWDSDSELMTPLANMKGYNKFAVAAADFAGKWTSDFTGIQQLYHVYTGNYAGMHINQSNEEFIFGAGGTYNWKLLVINGMAGNAQFNQVKSSGKISVLNNWQVHFTKIETGPRTYNAFWSCIKGARILNLLDAQYPGSGIYTQYGLAK